MGATVAKGLLAVLLSFAVLAAGCGGEKAKGNPDKQETRIVHIGYWGGTCEAPIYIAYEKGIFKKNGLDVELVKLGNTALNESIATGKVDALMATPGIFKAMEQGLDITLTGGIHTGCIQAVTPIDSPIQSIADLKGKTVGTDSLGGVPMTLLSMELLKLGINPKTEVNWVVYPGAQLNQAMRKGEINAFATWDPFPEIAVQAGTARVFFSNTHSYLYADQYCCYVGINGKVVKKEPAIAKAITKSFDEAAQWVAQNPQAAAELSVDKKYTSGDAKLNASLLAQYEWSKTEKKARESYVNYLKGMQSLGMLDANTDVNILVKKTLVYLGER